MLKCPIHELPGNVIIDNFYARLSFQDKTLLDTSCSGSFTRKNEEFKRDLLDRIQENTEGWENDKDRESAYIEKTPFPAKMKEYSVISSAVNKSEKKPKEPEEQIKIEPAVAIVKDLVTENVEDGHIIFCEDASNIVSHPNKSKQVSVPMLSVRIGDHCYYGLCDIGASVSAIPYELYTEIMHEIGSCELEDIDVVIHLANRETISPIGIVRDVEVLCEVFMDDFSVYGNSFDNCLRNLDKVLQRCEETNLVLNWEKCHFMVNEGIVLGHKISERGIEVDRAKVEAIEKMPYPRDVKGSSPPALDLDSFPCVEEAIRVADEFCDQYRALRREVEILQEENQRLRRMLEYYSNPSTRPSPPHSGNNESFQVLVQNCKIEKLKLKEILMKREKNPSPPSPKE
ncbi:hypothetical protein QYE76_042966 [Lolium multiflorum]|uniref:Reverse transcriptase domain-containing protein n=1 Tax=Lolium multiflorum TaxID=4521 RepID=A0AAD8TI64_LOLMU|nr:hypothetical protein QYE76_042966 [Lolium multiflorum]